MRILLNSQFFVTPEIINFWVPFKSKDLKVRSITSDKDKIIWDELFGCKLCGDTGQSVVKHLL